MTVSVEERPAQAAEAPAQAKPEPVTSRQDGYAEFDDLLSKKARERDIEVHLGDEVLKLHLRAIGYLEYDRLQSQCPPTPAQKEMGLVYDDNTFGPKLIAAVVTRPKMDLDRATRLWNDPNWSGGEVLGLYRACVNICQVGIDVPFSKTG